MIRSSKQVLIMPFWQLCPYKASNNERIAQKILLKIPCIIVKFRPVKIWLPAQILIAKIVSNCFKIWIFYNIFQNLAWILGFFDKFQSYFKIISKTDLNFSNWCQFYINDYEKNTFMSLIWKKFGNGNLKNPFFRD